MALQDTLDQFKNFDVNDLDPNNIGAWPGAIKAIILVLVFGVVIGLGYSLYLTDKQTALEKSEQQEVKLRKEFEKKAERARNLDAYMKQKEEMQATFGALLRQLPSDTEVPGLIEDITRTALDHELKIEEIELKSERKTEFYVELPIEITVEGGYHKIGAFVSGVANLSRIVTLHNFNIEPAGSARNLKMTILAKTYRYLEDE